MALPSATPSPYRFLSAQSKAAASASTQDVQRQGSSQFAAPPHFRLSRQAPQYLSTAQSNLQISSPPARRSPKAPKEDIDSPPASSEDEDYDVPAHQTALPIRTPDHKRRRINPPTTNNSSDDAILISSSSSSASPASDASPHPSPPATPPITPAAIRPQPRSSFSAAVAGSSLPPAHTQHHHRQPQPHFLIPPSSHHNRNRQHQLQPLATPLSSRTQPRKGPLLNTSRAPVLLPPREPSPEPPPSAFFSPSRRKGRFLSGGLAMTVRDWVVEAGEVGYHQRRVGGGEKVYVRGVENGGEEGQGWWVIVVVWKDGDGGHVGDGGSEEETKVEQERRLLLMAREDADSGAGPGRRRATGTGRPSEKVKVGTTLVIRQPTWEITYRGQVCTVASEWQVLEHGDRGR